MDWKGLVSTVAPWIGTALGGPLGGMAVTAIGSALGLDSKSEDSIKQALAGVTPEQMLALKEADQNFALQMQAMGFKQVTDLEALEVGDRKDARAMQIANHSVVPSILTAGLTAGFFGVLLCKMFGVFPAGSQPIVDQMIGTLQSVWTASVAYWFGTTRNSFDKTQMLAQSTPPTK